MSSELFRPPRVSFVLATHNRRDVVLHTLARLETQVGLPRSAYEVIVVDDRSTDDTADAIRTNFRNVKLLHTDRPTGPVCKNAGIAMASGRYVVLLDDDSFPVPGSIARMIRHFVQSPTLGAAGFTVELPDGSRECSAYPDVFVGCGVGIRQRVLRSIGGLPNDYFMQAEEYDLSLRMLDAGWEVKTFDDLRVTHLKSPLARASRRTTRLDVRNNLTLIARRFPKRHALPFALDWVRRYGWIAAEKGKGHKRAFALGLAEGVVRATVSAATRRRAPVADNTFEQFAKLDDIEERLRQAKERLNLRRVLLLDVGKNILAFHRAAQRCGVEIVAIADERLGKKGRKYRGVRVVDYATARLMDYDAAVVANLSPVHSVARRDAWRLAPNAPPRGRVIDLYEVTETVEAPMLKAA